MRLASSALLLALSTNACLPHSHDRARATTDLIVSGVFVAGAIVHAVAEENARAQSAQPAPEQAPPPPLPTPAVTMSHGGAFDRSAARSALQSVVYKDCGQGGPGLVTLVFAQSGSVVRASVDAPYEVDIERCVLGRFHLTRIPAFTDAKEHAVSFRIHLPTPVDAVAP